MKFACSFEVVGGLIIRINSGKNHNPKETNRGKFGAYILNLNLRYNYGIIILHFVQSKLSNNKFTKRGFTIYVIYVRHK